MKRRIRNSLSLANQFITMDLVVRPHTPDPPDNLVHYVREQIFQLLEDLPDSLSMNKIFISFHDRGNTIPAYKRPVNVGGYTDYFVFTLYGNNPGHDKFECTRRRESVAFSAETSDVWIIRFTVIIDDEFTLDPVVDELQEKGWRCVGGHGEMWNPPARLLINPLDLDEDRDDQN